MFKQIPLHPTNYLATSTNIPTMPGGGSMKVNSQSSNKTSWNRMTAWLNSSPTPSCISMPNGIPIKQLHTALSNYVNRKENCQDLVLWNWEFILEQAWRVQRSKICQFLTDPWGTRLRFTGGRGRRDREDPPPLTRGRLYFTKDELAVIVTAIFIRT